MVGQGAEVHGVAGGDLGTAEAAPSAFGGGLPWAQVDLVDQEFLDLTSEGYEGASPGRGWRLGSRSVLSHGWG